MLVGGRVLYKRPSQTQPPSTFEVTARKPPVEPSAELTGLAPATTYQLRVRVRTVGGWSSLSAAISATTAPPLRPPLTPTDAPELLRGTCTSLTLRLPQLRGGCTGDESLSVEWRESRWADVGAGAGWQLWRDPAASGQGGGSTAREAVLSGLQPDEAYEARVTAHNAHGVPTRRNPHTAAHCCGRPCGVHADARSAGAQATRAPGRPPSSCSWSPLLQTLQSATPSHRAPSPLALQQSRSLGGRWAA